MLKYPWRKSRFSTIGFYEPYTKADFKRLAYAAYLAGAERIGWFSLGTDERDRAVLSWQRTDQEGKETFDAINEINKELMSLPVFNSSPKVLEIAEYDGAGNSMGLGLLEWDNTNQIHASKPSFNLSKYNLIIVKEQPNLLSDFVGKLNQYVANGGNLVLLGDTGSSLTDPFGEVRPNLMIENGVVSYQYNNDPISFSLTGSNPLELVTEFPLSTAERYSLSFTSSSNSSMKSSNL